MSVFGSLDTPYILFIVIQNYIRFCIEYLNYLAPITPYTIHYTQNINQSLNIC